MTFTKKLDSQKKFGARETRTVSVKVPIDEYETILATVKSYIDSFREDNPQKIDTIQDGIEEIVSVVLDVKDYINKEDYITKNKYLEIFSNHNSDLISDLIATFSITRKPPIKTLTEEKKEEELKKRELRRKAMLKTGWEGFGIKHKDYLTLKELNTHYKKYKEKTKRAKKLWDACLEFYGDTAYERETSYIAPKPYVAPKPHHKPTPLFLPGSPGYEKHLDKLMKRANKRNRKENR